MYKLKILVASVILFSSAQTAIAQTCLCEPLIAANITDTTFASVRFGVTVEEDTESGKCFVQGEINDSSGDYVRLDVTHERNPTASSAYRCLAHTPGTPGSLGRVMKSNAEIVQCAREVENLAVSLLATNTVIDAQTGQALSTGTIRGKCVKAIAGKKQ